MWNARTGEPVAKPLAAGGSLGLAKFSPDGALVATLADDGTARLWSTRTGEAVGKRMLHDGSFYAARFSPDGRRLVTASYDRSARMWSVPGGEPVGQTMRHKKRVYSAIFSPEGDRVATSSADNTARLWDARTGEPLGPPMNFGGWAYLGQFTRDGQRLLISSADQTASVWDVPTAAAADADLLAATAEAVGGCRLNEVRGVMAADEPVARVAELRRRVASAAAGQASGASLVHWLLSDRYTRTISPLSPVLMDEYVRERLQEGKLGEIRKAFPGFPLPKAPSVSR